MCTAVGEVEVQEVPIPKVREGYTLFKIKAVALNPTDWKSIHFKDGGAVGTRLGVDFAGVVEEVGPGVTKQWKKGDRVCGGVYGA
jgi:NADPH:quinone reductase-like Zn-dependent oxidoreductase